MAGPAMGSKRARVAAFSAHERYMHKSNVILQREGKKIRTFLVRRAVAQLKQTRTQQETATAKVHEITDANKRKRAEGKAKKLMYQVEKLEKELMMLKTLDLKAVVARAFETTGLQEEEEEEEEEEREQVMSAHDREMAKYGRGRVVDDMDHHDEDDGFNSEDYEEAPREDSSSDSEENESEEEKEKEEEEEVEREEAEDQDDELHVVQAEAIPDGAVVFGPTGPPGTTDDSTLIQQLVDRVLAHNQMKPFLDAIHEYVAKRAKDQEKKRRQKEKSALKRARASMIGGRSSAAPTSMFFGSLSGDVPDDEEEMDMGGVGRASMAGAEDDIAEFLGETMKKKNRPGQMARRQKAMRLEEARRREQEGEASFPKRRFHDREGPSTGKYGPSERPKKQTKKDPLSKPAKDKGSWQDHKRGYRETKDTERRPRHDAPKPKPVPQRKPEAEPSHPSWVAKQAMKEKMKVDINAFSGKKITFGDD